MNIIRTAALLFFFILTLPLSGAPEAVFQTPDPGAAYFIADGSGIVREGTPVRYFETRHPLVRIYSFFPARDFSGRQIGFVSPSFVVDPAAGKAVYYPMFSQAAVLGALVSFVVLLFLLFQKFRKQEIPFFWLAVPVLLRLTLMLATLIFSRDIFPTATDEPGYFKTMNDILHGIWRTPWNFTVGTGFFYLPFMLLLGAKEYYDLVPVFNYFSALVIAPGCMVMLYWILRKLGASCRAAGIVLLIWAVYPFFVFHLEYWETQTFQAFFALPPWLGTFDFWRYYAVCINAGFNAMSDTPGLLLVLLTQAVILSMPEKRSSALLAGGLFGISCLVRINYIILSPLIAFLLFFRFRHDRKLLLQAAVCSAAGFLICFAVQLIANVLQFGSPLTFGYVLHYPELAAIDRPAAGFTWHTFLKWTNLRQMTGANLPVWAAGFAALWCMRDRFRQGMLMLWSVPLIIFFAGYSHTGCDARRFVFPVFCAMLCAAALLEIWKTCGKKELFMVLFPLILLLLFSAPLGGVREMPLLLGKSKMLETIQLLIPFFAAAGIVYLLRQKAFAAAVFLMLSLVFFTIPAVLMAGIFLLPVYVVLQLIYVQCFVKHPAAVEDLACEEE